MDNIILKTNAHTTIPYIWSSKIEITNNYNRIIKRSIELPISNNIKENIVDKIKPIAFDIIRKPIWNL